MEATCVHTGEVDMRDGIKYVADKYIAGAMEEYGFSFYSDSLYIKSRDNIKHILDIQKSKINKSHEIQFTLNCGISFKECFRIMPTSHRLLFSALNSAAYFQE
jgi:hypothetical protein